MWKMGFFEDIDVEAEVAASGGVIADLRRQGEAVDPQGPDRRQRRARARQDQRGHRPQARRHPRHRQGQEEPREDRGPLRREGLLPGHRRLRDQAGQRVRGRRLVHDRRERQGQDPRGPVHRQQHGHRRRAARLIATRRQDALSFLQRLRDLQPGGVRARPAARHAHYWDNGYATSRSGTPQLRLSRDKQYMYLSIPIDEGPVFTIGAVDFKGDLIGSAAQTPRADHDAARATRSIADDGRPRIARS